MNLPKNEKSKTEANGILYRKYFLDLIFLPKYECPKCFEACDSQRAYSLHLEGHFPRASTQELTKIDHIVSSKMFKKMPSHDRRNPAFTGYVKSKPYRKIGQYPAVDEMIAWAVIIGELG